MIAFEETINTYVIAEGARKGVNLQKDTPLDLSKYNLPDHKNVLADSLTEPEALSGYTFPNIARSIASRHASNDMTLAA